MTEEFDEDQFGGYVSVSYKERYAFFDDILPQQEQSSSTIQNDIQQNPIFSIPQQNNIVQPEPQNNIVIEQQSNQGYQDEEFSEGELIEDPPQHQSNAQNEQILVQSNQEQKENLNNVEINSDVISINQNEKQQNVQLIQQESKVQVQLTSIFDAFPSELVETTTQLQQSPILLIPQSQQEIYNDQKQINNLNLIEMYQQTMNTQINNQNTIQNDDPKKNESQSKIEHFNLIDINAQSDQITQQQHFEQKSNNLLQFSNEKTDQQQVLPLQQPYNNTLSLYNYLSSDIIKTQQQVQIHSFENPDSNCQNFENQKSIEETNIPNQQVQNVQFNDIQSHKQENNYKNDEMDEFGEFVIGEQTDSLSVDNSQNQNQQNIHSIGNLPQNPQIVPNVQVIQNTQEQQFVSSSQPQIQVLQNYSMDFLNVQLTPIIINQKEGPQRSEPVQKRNWRNQIEDIVGFDSECMDSFLEELNDLKLNLYKAQVLEYTQLAKDIQALRKKKQIHVDKEEYEEATVIRDTLRAKEPIAMVLKKKILQIAKVIDLMDQQDLDYHIKKYIFDQENEITQNPSIEMLLPKIQIVEDFVNKLKKELKKSESVLSIIKLQGQLEKVRYEKKYQNFILGLRKIIGMSHRFTQLTEIVQAVNDRLSDLKIDKEVIKLDYEFIFENTMIPFLKGQQQQQNYCNYCFQSKSDLIEYKGKLYDVCCLNFYYNIN